MAQTLTAAWSLPFAVATVVPLTMFCRFRISTLADRDLMAIHSGNAVGWKVYMFGGQLSAFQRRGSGLDDYVTATAPPVVGVWNSALYVAYDQLNFFLGVNGGNLGHTNAGGPLQFPPDQTSIGSVGTATDVCEFAMWNVALPGGWFAALHKGASPLHFAARSLVFYAQLLGRDSPERCLINGPLTIGGGSPVRVDHPPVYRPRRRANYAHLSYTVPIADFALDVTSGPSPAIVRGQDISIHGPPRAWNWERRIAGGGAYASFASTKNTGSIPFTTGNWDIRLTATCPGGADIEEKLTAVRVGPPTPPPSTPAVLSMGAGI